MCLQLCPIAFFILLAIELLGFTRAPSPLSVRSDLPFIEACRRGDRAEVLSYLRKGQNVNIVDRSGLFPLQIASHMGHIDIVILLLENDANVNLNPSYYSAVYVAKTEDITLLLISKGADIKYLHSFTGGYPLSYALFHKAASNGWDRLLCAMHNEIQDPDAPDCSLYATALFAAARSGQISSLRMLLEWGAVVDHTDNYGRTPLIAACAEGQIETAKVLLQAGANPNHRMKHGDNVLQATTSRCWTPNPAGYTGIESNIIPIVKLLISSGARIDKKNLDNFRKAQFLSNKCQETFSVLQDMYKKGKVRNERN